MRKAENDKSKFFETAGYNLDNWRVLERHIRGNILPLEAVPTKKTPDGQKYEIEGILPGVNGVKLLIITVWMKEETQTRLITVIPVLIIYDD